jgi:hypothetical protein
VRALSVILTHSPSHGRFRAGCFAFTPPPGEFQLSRWASASRQAELCSR